MSDDPGNARSGRLVLEFRRSGMGAGDKHYLNNAFATTADVDDYIEP